MPLDTRNSGFKTGGDIPAVWEFPEALRLLAECGDTELLEELIALFQSDTSSRLEVLGRAVAEGDLPVVRMEAHTIKGSAVQVGAERVADVCRKMELEAAKNPPRELFSLFTRLQKSFEEVCRVMTEKGQSGANPRLR
jgi:HPt (histidine-containing phosphotransfer) domain-containing protein